ncbi:MAG: hypothetical protein ACYDCH_13645 [Gaiellaceae bacterium]
MKRAAFGAVLLSALLLPGLARAETIPGSLGAQDSLLAVAGDGTPRVAFVAADNSLQVAQRSPAGVWSAQPIVGLPGTRALVAGLDTTPSGSVVLLAEDPNGGWLALAEQQGASWRVRTVARPPKGGILGFGGLALDAAGRAQIAYAYELGSGKTWLRFVHEDAAGRLIGEAVTKGGFPPSIGALPAVDPVVLPGGTVRILEAYASATIEWSRTKNHKDWQGQFIYAQSLGTPGGVVRAGATAAGVWSAWTELFPNFDESQLLLTLHHAGETTTILSHHAFLIGLSFAATGPEVAADDYVDVNGARTVYAGIVVDASGATTELAGDLEGYGIDAGGGRQYLLVEPAGLGWYRAAAAPTAAVTLSAAVDGAAFALSGRVDGAAPGASVELWRETQTGPELAGTLPLAADGTFSASDLPASRPLTYRAIYRDPVSGLPLAALVRTLLGG